MLRVKAFVALVVLGVGASCGKQEAAPVTKSVGVACAAASECTSGFCRDAVCCNGACSGLCEQCNTLSDVGTCRAAPVGEDPHNECAQQSAATCGTTGTCNGARACSLYATGYICAAAACGGDFFTADQMCDGQGTCVAIQGVNCAPWGCSGAAGCSSSCGVDAGSGCAVNSTCVAVADGGSARCKGNTSVYCRNSAECNSGTCGVDAGADAGTCL